MKLRAWLKQLLDSPEQAKIRAAEERWRKANAAAKAAGCACGAPATVAREHHGAVGSVPYQWWTCAEHAGASSFLHHGDHVTAYWRRPAPCDGCGIDRACGGKASNIKTGEITSYSCPLRPAGHDSAVLGG